MDAGAVRRRNLSAVLELVHRAARRHARRPHARPRPQPLDDRRPRRGPRRARLGRRARRRSSRRASAARAPGSWHGMPARRRRSTPSSTSSTSRSSRSAARSSPGAACRCRRPPTVAATVRQITGRTVAELAAQHPEATCSPRASRCPGSCGRVDGQVRLAPRSGWREEPLAAQLAEPPWACPSPPPTTLTSAAAPSSRSAPAGGARDALPQRRPEWHRRWTRRRRPPMDGAAGYAGEIGHSSVDPNGPLCACGASRLPRGARAARRARVAPSGSSTPTTTNSRARSSPRSSRRARGGPVHDEVARPAALARDRAPRRGKPAEPRAHRSRRPPRGPVARGERRRAGGSLLGSRPPGQRERGAHRGRGARRAAPARRRRRARVGRPHRGPARLGRQRVGARRAIR